MALIAPGPCLWDEVDPLCTDEWPDFPEPLRIQALEFAKTIVWAATGRQFGLCSLTVRPCGRQCENCAQGWFWDNGGWYPYINSAGLWKNCWCGSGPGCGNCMPECVVYLPGPVYSIQEVRIGGESLTVTGGQELFVYDQQWLVRVDTTKCWPLCTENNLSLPVGDPNIFEVTYLRGRPVPIALAYATASYAVEYAKACLGLACRLPGRVSSLSRQGVTISMVGIEELLRNNLTGLIEVDQLIASYNPYGLKGRTRFWSPELQEPRQVTFP